MCRASRTSHYNNSRTAATLHEKILTPQNVNAQQFGKLGAFKVDGAVYAQPLYVPAVPASKEPVPRRIWITDVTIVSPENLAHLDRGSVLIENERFVRVETKTSAKPPANATVVSGEGGFLIPGLIDSHVHLASVPGIAPELDVNPDAAHGAILTDYYKQLPRSYLYFGYTTLIDLSVVKREVLGGFRRAPLHPDLCDVGHRRPSRTAIPCPLRLQRCDSNSFRISFTTRRSPPAFLPNTSPRITLPRRPSPPTSELAPFASKPTLSTASAG